MAHDSEYRKTGNPNTLGFYKCGKDLDNLGDISAGAVNSSSDAAKAMVSKQGQHKGSLLYTKYDKSKK